MKINCPACQAVGKIDDKWQGKQIRCPKCQEVFIAQDISHLPSHVSVVPEPLFVSEEDQSADENHIMATDIVFSGQAGEFFRIWIVNLFMTIVTFGIYTPWAKVRTRNYFFSHTATADTPFAYLADPLILLRGYIVVFGGFLIYSAINATFPPMALVVMLLFGLIFPFLLFKSHRFQAYNSAYRGIRFHFLGTLKESYIIYLALPVLIPLTLGLIFPYWAFRQKQYFMGNMAFGNSKNDFKGKSSYFYGIYIRALLMLLGLFVPLVGLFFMFGFADGEMFRSGGGGAAWGVALIAVIGFFYVGVLLVTTFIQQYIYARITNYCWENSTLGNVTFSSTMRARDLMIIRVTNILALVISFGLLYPWTKIRRSRYVLHKLQLQVAGGLDVFMARNEQDQTGLGEAALDFFDFEIGL